PPRWTVSLGGARSNSKATRSRRGDAAVLQYRLERDRAEDARAGGSGLRFALAAASYERERRTFGRLRFVGPVRSRQQGSTRFGADALRNGSGFVAHGGDRAPVRHSSLLRQCDESQRVRCAGL